MIQENKRNIQVSLFKSLERYGEILIYLYFLKQKCGHQHNFQIRHRMFIFFKICYVKAVTRQLRYLQQKWFAPFSIAIESVKKTPALISLASALKEEDNKNLFLSYVLAQNILIFSLYTRNLLRCLNYRAYIWVNFGHTTFPVGTNHSMLITECYYSLFFIPC